MCFFQFQANTAGGVLRFIFVGAVSACSYNSTFYVSFKCLSLLGKTPRSYFGLDSFAHLTNRIFPFLLFLFFPCLYICSHAIRFPELECLRVHDCLLSLSHSLFVIES